jgi:hypothetical protein
MIKLPLAIAAWNSADFKHVLQLELAKIPYTQLPLQQALTQSSSISDDPLQVMMLNVTDKEHVLLVKAAVFYTGVISGCSCSDDPTPLDTVNEYCELMLQINKLTADTHIQLCE